MTIPKVIIIGSNGMLGKYVKKYFYFKYEVISINRNMYDIESNNPNYLLNLIQNISTKNDVVINCAGLIPQRKSESKEKYIIVNSLFPHQLKNICTKLKLKLIHITTDCVFSGKRGNYTESDEHDGVDVYSKSKSLGEPNDICIIRTSIIGEEENNKKSLLEWVISNKNSTIDGYMHTWNGLTCLELSKVIYKIVSMNLYWEGVRHIHSPKSITKYELIKIINTVYKLNIIIDKVENYKSMSLKTNYRSTLSFFNIKSIEDQIKELKEFNINNRSTF